MSGVDLLTEWGKGNLAYVASYKEANDKGECPDGYVRMLSANGFTKEDCKTAYEQQVYFGSLKGLKFTEHPEWNSVKEVSKARSEEDKALALNGEHEPLPNGCFFDTNVGVGQQDRAQFNPFSSDWTAVEDRVYRPLCAYIPFPNSELNDPKDHHARRLDISRRLDQ